MNPRKYIHLPFVMLSIVLILITQSSCEKFLTEDLKGTFSTDTYYQNETQAIQGINGVYNAVSFTSPDNAIWVFGDVASDDAVKGGNPGDQAEISYIDDFTADANNGIINNYWSYAYEAIARANNIIFYVPDVPMNEGLRNRIVGEAKFWRAYSYFNLVNIFGEVPLKLLPQTSSDAIHVPLTNVAVIYGQIEQDLKDAITVLPESYDPSVAGRITRGGALGMHGKVSLYQGKWDEAINYFHQLENLGVYALLPNYGNNFKLEFENSIESIIEIQHLAGQNPGLGSSLNQWFAPSVEGGYYFNAPTQALVESFETVNDAADPRLDISIGRAGETWLNGEPFSAGWSPTGFLTKKHQQPLSEVPISLKGDGDLNYIYMRFGDVLLMKAEAFNETGQTDSALVNLNRVRERARNSFEGTPPPELLADIIITDNNLLREAIRRERRVELALEFHRFFDLMRWGRAAAEAVLGPDFSYDVNRYFPIPQDEVDSNQAIP